MTNPPENPSTTKLPKLRKNITVVFNDYNKDGKPEWLIHDSGRNKFYIIGWPDFEILERWNLANIHAIVDSVNQETTLHIDETDVEKLLFFLTQNYLITQSSKQISKHAEDQKLFKNDNKLSWLISHYLFFRIPLVNPDKFLAKTKVVGKIVFNRYTSYLMMILALLAIYQLSTQWEQFTHSFASVFTWQGIFFYFIAFTVVKLCHELGHAYMCKHYGIPVPALGVAFLVFWPVLYTDTTLSWSLKSEKRLRIAIAGIWVESYITIIAALIWCNSNNLTLLAICYAVITINWIGSILINISPFMRFDGYYILADYLKMPNLQPRAFALTRWQIRKWLFGWKDLPPEKFTPRMHYFLVAYSIATWIYRLILYIGIAILVYHFFVKILGIILFVVELYYFILAPFVTEVKTWIAFKDRFTLNIQTKITIAISLILIIFLLTPLSNTMSLPATISYDHTFLIAPAEGYLDSDLPPIGSKILANTPIITIRSSDLDQSIIQSKYEYEKKLIELRRSGMQKKYAYDRLVILSDLKKTAAQYQKILDAQKKLSISVSFNGILIESDPELSKNTFIMQGEWIADVINPNVYIIEAYVSQLNSYRIKKNQIGYFYSTNFHQKRIPVIVKSIEVINANQLNCNYSNQLKQHKGQETVVETPCYNASELGGEIPTFLSEEGKYVPVDSVYRVILTTNEKPSISTIERGTIELNTSNRQSIAYSFFYKFKTLWVEQSEF